MGRRTSFTRTLLQISRDLERAQKAQMRRARALEREAVKQQRESKQQYQLRRQAEADRLSREAADEVQQLRTLLQRPLQKFAGLNKLKRWFSFPAASPPEELIRARVEPTWDEWKKQIAKPKRVGFFEFLFHGRLGKNKRVETHLAAEVERVQGVLAQAIEDWKSWETERERRLAAYHEGYERDRQQLIKEIEEHNAQVDELQEAYLRGEPDAILTFNEALLAGLHYPEDFPSQCEASYCSKNRELVVDYQLPAPAAMPDVAEYKYVKTKDSIEPKTMKVSDQNSLYKTVIQSLVLRTLKQLVVAAHPSKLETLVLNGLVETTNPATGRRESMCAISVRIHKEQMVNVNLSHLDPEACLKNFKARLLTKVDPFTPVVPLQAREGSEVADLKPAVVMEPVKPKAPEAVNTGSGWAVSVKPAKPPAEPITVSVTAEPAKTFSIPKPPVGATSPEWIPHGQTVTVQGMTIPGGLLYVGPKLKAANGSIEPALINPQLSIAKNVVDETERLMDYWPCYSQVSPKARRAYLQWLSHGRRSSDTNVGYVFLFFYGLERRALLDLSPSDPEVTIIEAEVRRLLTIYGDNYSFRNYAQGFLSHLKNARSAHSFRIPEQPPKPQSDQFELPLEMKYALGQFAAQGRPLDSAWAKSWALSDPYINKRMPVTRCADQFDVLFAEKFAQRFPEGLLIPKGKTRLKAAYQPASGGFRGQDLSIDLGDLPDVTANASAREYLQNLVSECSDALDPYSRYLGRNPGQENSLEALLQLPVALWPLQSRSQLEAVRDSVQQGRLSLSFAELGGKLNSAGAFNKDKTMGLARALESVYVGLEPDVLGGAKLPKAEDRVVLFHSRPEDGQLRSTPSYHAAAVAIGLAFNVAMADGDFSQDEADFLAERINSWPDLSDAQKLRLHAHLHMQKEQPISLATYKKKLEPLPQPARATIGKFLAHLAQADGVVSPSEVKLLEKLYKTLGLDPQTVFGDLHKAPPATVKPSTPGFALDLDRIAELKKETEQVTAILREVFADEEVDKPEPEPVPSGLLGLDNDHSLFLRLLFSRASWSRQEVEDAASDMGLMTDGALEQINEASFDKFSEVLLEGEDPLEINPQVMEMVLA